MASKPFSLPIKIKNIVYNQFEIPSWYWSPFPVESQVATLWYCDFCLSHFASKSLLIAHYKACTIRHPPGNEIYRFTHNSHPISVFEVDGAKERTYCQNLCLLSRLFLEHKFLQFDTVPFLFYIFCIRYPEGFVMASYFSREKFSEYSYNLACILTLPCFQAQGYGNIMLYFSYEMSRRENKVGTPESPISELGLLAYRKIWSILIFECLVGQGKANSGYTSYLQSLGEPGEGEGKEAGRFVSGISNDSKDVRVPRKELFESSELKKDDSFLLEKKEIGRVSENKSAEKTKDGKSECFVGLLNEISINMIKETTFMRAEDIVETLKFKGWLKLLNGEYVLIINEKEQEEMKKKVETRFRIVPERFYWAPFGYDAKVNLSNK